MNKNITDIYNLIQELSWYFGNQGFDGECCNDLSLVEFIALKKVYEKENIMIQETGNALNITKSGASKIIDRLENKHYVLRMKSPVDGRICCVVITEEGKEAIKKIEEQYITYVSEMLKDLEPEAVDNIKNVLDGLITSVRKHGFIKLN
jgi:MarR family transcriptional regulator, organic hydroperoxide resistance regulator